MLIDDHLYFHYYLYYYSIEYYHLFENNNEYYVKIFLHDQLIVLLYVVLNFEYEMKSKIDLFYKCKNHQINFLHVINVQLISEFVDKILPYFEYFHLIHF
jgi:hypothetical protein